MWRIDTIEHCGIGIDAFNINNLVTILVNQYSDSTSLINGK
jgi:hypothetical protein